AVERVVHQEAVAESVFNRASAHLKVAHPAPAVTLRSIPDVVLHAQMRRVRTDGPHLVQPRIRRLKIPLILHRIVDTVQINGLVANIPAAREPDERIAEGILRPISSRVRRNMNRINTKVWLKLRLLLRLAILHRRVS